MLQIMGLIYSRINIVILLPQSLMTVGGTVSGTGKSAVFSHSKWMPSSGVLLVCLILL